MDSYFANVGAVPVVPGFGGQAPHGHRHRHHRHHKSKHGHVAATPISRDQSISKVVHGHNQYAHQNEHAQLAGGYGVPYGAAGYGAGVGQFGGPYQLQQQYPGANFDYSSAQYQNNPFGTVGKRHRRHHHRHHRHQGGEILAGAAAPFDQAQAVPEPLIGQRPASVSAGHVDGQQHVDQSSPEKLRRHHHHQRHYRQESLEHKVAKPHRRSRSKESKHGHSRGGSGGYGHLNGDLIFIERGEHSPHRQEPPSGYEYKGKIEVQCEAEVTRSRSRGHVAPPRPQPLPLPAPLPAPAPLPVPISYVNPCPPGWQQVSFPTTGVAYPTGATGYVGQGGFGVNTIGQTGFAGGVTGLGLGGVSAIGAAGTGGFGTYTGTSQGQLIADYIMEAGGSGGQSQSQYYHEESREGRVTTRGKVIEVWQKRSKHHTGGGEGRREEGRSTSRHSDRERESHTHGPSFDFERFRKEILSAIERISKSTGDKYTFQSNEGGTQTHIRPHETTDHHETRPAPGGGEVRVIVQPIQPVFYMPRQPERSTTPRPGPQPHIPFGGGVEAPTQQTKPGAPQIVYVPRNVYVPVIKPVFVPRERVIVRPQVIHVARPVLVDRPVPVTQRPIIIDRERPIPVPVRTAGQAAAQTGGTNVVREEYVYRDNLPVAYGGRCAEYAGGVNYGYMPTQQEHQYTTSTVHQESVGYQAAAPAVYEQTQTVNQANYQQDFGNYQQSYVDTAQASNFAAGGAQSLNCSGVIEVLDTTVNSSWQRTDQSHLANRYGQTAIDIVKETDAVGQQMFQGAHQGFGGAAAGAGQQVYQEEVHQEYSSGVGGGAGQQVFQEAHQGFGGAAGGGVYRSSSAATYSSSSGYQGGPHSQSFSSIPLGDINCLNPEGIPHVGPAPIPVRINY